MTTKGLIMKTNLRLALMGWKPVPPNAAGGTPTPRTQDHTAIYSGGWSRKGLAKILHPAPSPFYTLWLLMHGFCRGGPACPPKRAHTQVRPYIYFVPLKMHLGFMPRSYSNSTNPVANLLILNILFTENGKRYYPPYPAIFFRARANPGAAAAITCSETQKARRK